MPVFLTVICQCCEHQSYHVEHVNVKPLKMSAAATTSSPYINSLTTLLLPSQSLSLSSLNTNNTNSSGSSGKKRKSAAADITGSDWLRDLHAAHDASYNTGTHASHADAHTVLPCITSLNADARQRAAEAKAALRQIFEDVDDILAAADSTQASSSSSNSTTRHIFGNADRLPLPSAVALQQQIEATNSEYTQIQRRKSVVRRQMEQARSSSTSSVTPSSQTRSPIDSSSSMLQRAFSKCNAMTPPSHADLMSVQQLNHRFTTTPIKL